MTNVFSWLRGWDSNPRPIDYTCLPVSQKGGLYHHRFFTVQGASHPDIRDSTPKRIVSEPSRHQQRSCWRAWLLITLPYGVGLPAIHPVFIPAFPQEAASRPRVFPYGSLRKSAHKRRFRRVPVPRNACSHLAIRRTSSGSGYDDGYRERPSDVDTHKSHTDHQGTRLLNRVFSCAAWQLPS